MHGPRAEPVQVFARRGDRLGVAREHGPVGRTQPLVEADRDRVHRRGELGDVDRERGRRVHEPCAVEVHARAVLVRRGGERRRRGAVEHRPAGARVRVLETDDRGVPRHDRRFDLFG